MLAQRGNAKALGFFKKSVDAARSVGLREYEEMALARLATAYFELERFDELIETCDEMWEVAESSGNIQNMLCAKHGIGIGQMLIGNRRKGLRSLNAAIQIAREKKQFDWIVRCLVDRTRPVANGTFGELDLKKVLKAAQSEARSGNKHVAAALFVRIANHIQVVGGDPRQELLALDQAWNLLKRVKNIHEDSIYSLQQIHAGFWLAQRFDEALTVHAKLENAADGIMALEYSNSRGCLLMELDRQPEAEVIYSRLVEETRALEAPEVLAMLLNNLGECLRQQDRHDEAEAAYEESETIAAEVGDYESEIGTVHNRAIAYQNDGDLDRATKLFERCRDKAERRKYWKEYVRAWEALAGVASQQGKEGLAKNRYDRAIKEAKKHKCDDNLGRIALNYSNWLYYEGDARAGLKLLKRYQEKFDHFADSHIYYFAMGLCQEDLQKFSEAVETFKNAQQRSLRFGNEYYVAKCASHIVDIGIYINTPVVEIRNEIEPLLKVVKDPTEQLTILESLLRIEITADDEKRGQRVYNRGKRISEKHDIPLGLIDLNLVVADAGWKSGEYEQKLHAMRIWSDAFGHTLLFDVENGLGDSDLDELELEDGSMCGELMGPVTLLVSRPPHNSNTDEFDRLLNDLRQQLYKEIGSSKQKKETVEFMLRAFDMAKLLIPFADKPRKQLRELDNFLEEL